MTTSGGSGPIEIIGYLNLVGALVAFFLAARVVALDGREPRARGRSWILLVCATALLAALLAVGLFVDAQEAHTALLWAQRLIGSALVVSLLAGCYFLYGRERRVGADLKLAAETHSRRSRRLEAIVALGDELRTVRSVDEVARVAASAVEKTLAFRETALYLYDEDEGVFRTAAAVGAHPEYDAVVRDRRIPPDVLRGVLREEFRSGNVFFVDHTRYEWTEEELHHFPPGPVPDGGPGAFHADDALFAPLYDHEGVLIGMFDLYDPADGLVPGDETLQMLEVFANVTASALENAAYAADLEQLAVTDGLTGLYNHRHFQESLVAEVERAVRYDLVFSLLMMDLDLFKTVNDRLGHPRGDEALRAVAEVLLGNARTTDLVARYGGEEFVMILPGTSMKQAAVVAERVAQGVREIDLDVPDPPRLSISIGVADFPACGRDRESLIAAADAALLFAKRSGRDMIADFSQLSLVELDQSALEGLAFRLEKADIETLETLAAAIDRRDAFAGEHAGNVAAAAGRVAATLGLDDQQRDVLRMAALVYDIGKVGIPVEVLNRRGALDDDELEAIRRHPEVGKRLLESTMRLNALLPVVLHHHERWDGSGYPGGLAGESIPFAARVIAVCDAWQAMTTDRPYRPALTRENALAELRAGAGTQFDPRLVEAFLESLEAPAVSRG
jgi:diguanylate cyclase (GGDEF)-like protein